MVGGTSPDLLAGYGADLEIAASTASSKVGTPEDLVFFGGPRKEPSGNKSILNSTVGLSETLSGPT